MAQETTSEFSYRLRQAVVGHPAAPPSPHGRQSWLKDRLSKEASREVSANTVHKWINGMSRPRPDAMRDLARVLNVDEVWLSLGRPPVVTQPASEKPETPREAVPSDNATLLLAALIGVQGGHVTFPGVGESDVSLWANISGQRVGLIAVSPRVQDDKFSFIVPEPTGSNRVIAVIEQDVPGVSLAVNLLDLTSVPRDNLGGFSLVQATRTPSGFEIANINTTFKPARNLADLVAK
ncbi:helix-turn-helix domain-containing protein [Shimia sp.]|uniref:helix-turn-helix domain-containing protein n=1 Tax=Shimia sp. TaxID=1954381 RepID=UPI0032969470